MPSNPLLENNVQELLYVETHAEYSAGSGIDITNNVISLDPSVSAAIDNKLDTSSFSSYSATIDDELQYVSANAGKTYSGIAPIVVNNDTNEISADTQDISFGVGLDFTGGILSVTAQGGDPEVENVVKANSGYWNEVSSISSTSSLLNNQVTALRNDLNTVSTNTGYLYNDIQTTSGILSAAIDYVSANAGDEFPASANEAITAYQNASGTYLTAHQPISANEWNSVYDTVETNSGSWGGTSLTGDAQGAVDEVYSNSALWSEITGVSSNYVSQTDLEQISGDLKSDIDYVSANAITSLDGYATTSEVNTVSSYLSGQIDNKLDSTSFNPNDYYPMVGNPSGFISGVDLSDYQTKAGMTAYQPAGDYATTGDLYNTSSTLSGAIDYISGNAGITYTGVAPIVVTGNTISADSFDLNIGSGLAFENDTLYVSAESVPEGVMVESACEYNAVNEISAYNGSAIAQYGAEKQWLVHDDTLVHAANSAQYALGVNLSAVAQLLGVDETVLWEGSANTGTLNFTDPLTSFKEFKFYVDVPERGINKVLTFYDAVNTVTPGFIQLITTTMTTGSVVSGWWQGVYNINATVDTATYKSMSIYANGQYFKQCSTTACGTNASKLVVKKVIDIGRKA